MPFADVDSPLTEKILALILADEKIPVDEFKRRICNFRITKKEYSEIETYLHNNDLIRRERVGKEVYIIRK